MARWILIVVLALISLLAGLWFLTPKDLPTAVTEPQDNYVLEDQGNWIVVEDGEPYREEHYELYRGQNLGWWLLTAKRKDLDDEGTLKVIFEPDLTPAYMNLSITNNDGMAFESQVVIEGSMAKISSKTPFFAVITRDFELNYDPLIIEPTFYSTMFVLKDRLSSVNGTFRNYTAIAPTRMGVWDVDISAEGTASLPASGVTLAFDRYQISFGEIRAELFMQNGQLEGMIVPPNRTAYRSDLYASGIEFGELANKPLVQIPEGVKEEIVRFKSSDGTTLEGSLTLPIGALSPLPVLVMIGGGTSDRNQNFPGFLVNSLNAIAYHLASHGIASFRYDKRGIGKSEGNAIVGFTTPQLEDARAALKITRTHPMINSDEVFLLGHSEGALLGAILASEEDLAGFISLTSPIGRDFGWNWLWQTVDEQKALNKSQNEIDQEIENWEAMFEFIKSSSGSWSDHEFSQIKRQHSQIDESHYEASKQLPLNWWREILGHQPLNTMRMISEPILIIQGDKDLSVPFDEGQLVLDALREAGNFDVSYELLQDLNHFLRHHPEPVDALNSFRHLNKPVDVRVLENILSWLNLQLN